ncbi:MGH1-like glycoside hydrolase domain-containing protein [Aliiruegeria lutimaris]|uniref:Mannosylglycerate hydrolase MGH1-like glycoside hydrolase domain-containing protein n=1 Tax=Aliiruegeria lutimaris TaxID=571298 RepID=A0A1G9BNA2_9RHOB|nr:hypothetical protein [Aliiruegeria lutimaris]SDK40972.1 hypothetical protein SAMN04488026_104024 [Aliiruegeria lutimaris]
MTYEHLDEEARQILRDNDRGIYTVPTSGLYPYQWNWDSAFAAWGFSTFDNNRAWVELETLFASQWEDGMVPHIIFHRQVPEYFPGPDVWGVDHTPPTSGISQPPIAATMARAVYESDKAAGRARLEGLFEGLLNWHRWFMQARITDGLCCVTHPWESGRDNAPDWDSSMANVDTSMVGEYKRRDTSHVNNDMRPTKQQYDQYLALLYFSRDCGWDIDTINEKSPLRVADPGMHFMLLRAHRDLLWVAGELGKPDGAEIQGWIDSMVESAEKFWNEDGGYYDSINMRAGEFTHTLSCASFYCWYAGIDETRMVPHLERILGSVKYPVPSVDPARPDFDHIRYWRGPLWCMANSQIGAGLAEMGYAELAEKVRLGTRAVIADQGFAEYHSPVDGTPAGGQHFTWTAAVWLTFASPQAKGGF